MSYTQNFTRYGDFATLGTSGKQADVDELMEALAARDDLVTSRLVDFALGLVNTPEGVERMRHYLFNGDPRQRNYAALHFKRKGQIGILDEAVIRGKIDATQAYSK